MINSNAFNYVNVLSKAADASWTRNSIISNNIANVNTPNYKRQDLDFESCLRGAIGNGDDLEQAVQNVSIDELNPDVYTEFSTLSTRMDGNNVDIDVESASLAENQIKYYTLLDSISQEFSRLKSVINSV